jgi:hypothetical protein
LLGQPVKIDSGVREGKGREGKARQGKRREERREEKRREKRRENIKISAKESLGYCELKKYKPWFDQACSKLVDRRKQTKLQWLQDPSEITGDNLKTVRHEASRYFRNKNRKYLKDKINELATNSKNKNIRAYRVE